MGEDIVPESGAIKLVEDIMPGIIRIHPPHDMRVGYATADIFVDGKPDIVGGGMHVPGPPGRAGRLTLWQQK